jgi:DNA-binding LacI/PurR family transcriptional regulator
MAEKLGYRPDPHLSQLMGYLQKGKARGEASVIAVLSDIPEKQLPSYPSISLILQGLEERCAQLGYVATVFSLGDGLGPKRIQRILEARGIQGLIILPFRKIVFSLDEFDFAAFSAVSVGYSMQSPQLHRAASQQTLAAMRVFEHVLENGYKRIGMALSNEMDERTQHRYLAGFLGRVASLDIKAEKIPPFLFDKMDPKLLKKWISDNRLDAIVSSDWEMANELESFGLKPGKEIGLAMLDYKGPRELARMQVPYQFLGKAAVNLVHGLLSINERGLPELPSVLTVPGVWVDGPSLPRK